MVLMEQMELREALENAKDPSALDELRKRLRQEQSAMERQIGDSIDNQKDYNGAAGLVRKLQFLDRLDEEIDSAYEGLE